MFISYLSHKLYAAKNQAQDEVPLKETTIEEKKPSPLIGPFKALTPDQQGAIELGLIAVFEISLLYFGLKNPIMQNPTPAKTWSVIAIAGLLAGTLALLPHESQMLKAGEEGNYYRPG